MRAREAKDAEKEVNQKGIQLAFYDLQTVSLSRFRLRRLRFWLSWQSKSHGRGPTSQ